MTPFQQRIITIVQMVPAGKVVSYGQVAAYIGVPRAARQVGWVLRSLEEQSLPWWRVINNEGKITIKGNKYNDKVLQRKLLLADGVKVNENFELDIKKYRFIASIAQLQEMKLDDDYIKQIRTKYF